MMISGSISERVFLILPTAVVPPLCFIVCRRINNTIKSATVVSKTKNPKIFGRNIQKWISAKEGIQRGK